MRIIRVHNYYQQPGGEDRSFAAEITLLQQYGHEVVPVTFHNDQINGMRRLEIAAKTLWNQRVFEQLRAVVRRVRPAVVHFDNIFPLISPAAYYAVRAEGIPVVQSVRNYRLFCVSACFFRSEQVCEDCMGKAIPWPALRYRCYRDSRLATGVVTAMQVVHRGLGSWQHQVDLFIALTEFVRQKCIEGGLPTGKIVVKPDFIAADPGRGRGEGDYALFVGRLSPEKGVMTLLKAWFLLENMPLKIVGSGPLQHDLEVFIAQHNLTSVELIGQRSANEVFALMHDARCLIFPSECYETFGRSIIEAFACGLPVITANHGAMAEIVAHEQTGLLFQPGDITDLAAKINWFITHPDQVVQMRQNARDEYEARYSAMHNYKILMEIYRQASEAMNIDRM